MKKFLCYDTNDASSGKVNVSANGVLKPNSTVPSSSGSAYQQLVTDGSGNTKWEDRTHWVADGFSIAWDGDTTGHNNIDIGTILGRGEGTLMYKVHDNEIQKAFMLREYARTSSREYFADYFEYWIVNHEDVKMMNKIKNFTPMTYALFDSLEKHGWELD